MESASRIPAEPSPPDSLVRIEARLARIESALAPLASLTAQAPPALATLTDIVDDLAARSGDFDDRMSSLARLFEQLTRPGTLATLTTLVSQVEQMPALVAMAADIFDDAARRAGERGIDIESVLRTARQVFNALAEVAAAPEVHDVLASGMLARGALETLGTAARSLAEAREMPASRVGGWGALRALRDPDVQRALGFVMRAAKGFGHSMAVGEPKGLLPG